MHVYWHSGDKITDIIKYITSIEWSGADTEASRTLTISMVNDPYRGQIKPPELKTGDDISLYGEGKTRLFYGQITGKGKSGDIGTISYTARDFLFNVLKSNISHKYKNKTAEYIAQDACKRAGARSGSLVKTKIKLSKLYATDTPAYNVLMKAYHEASKKNGIQYMPYMNGTKLCVKEKGQLVGRGYNSSTKMVEESFLLSQANMVTASSYEENIDDMVNKVDIYNSKNKKIGTAKNAGWIKTFKTLQANLTVSKGNGKAAAKKMLKGKTKSMSLEAIGDERCISGAGIKVYDKASGLTGTFWIASDTHTFENGHHKMSLTLRLKNVTENPDVNSGSSSKSGASASVSTGILNGKKRKNLRFTAYAIGEGGNLDERGRKLKLGENTVAADFLKYGTKIQIFGTGTRYDKKVMTVRDSGLGNNSTIDILMSKSEESKWNNPHGYIIISDGTGFKMTGGGGTSTEAKKLITEAKKWLGKVKYLYGANNVPGGRADCSAFTHYVFKHALGKEIGRTTYTQINHGSKISKWSDLQAGDLIFFNIRGEGENSHVGMCIGGHKFIHCGCTYGVHIESMGSSYYRGQFYQGRRLI